MNYNIDFDIAAAIICLIIYLFNLLQYPLDKLSNRMYRLLLISTLLGAVLDAYTGITDSDPTVVPGGVNMLLNTMFFMVSVFLGFIYYRYVCSIVYGSKLRKFDYVCFAIILLYYVLLISNVFNGLIFTLNDNVYAFGPIHAITYVVPGVFIAFAWMETFKGFKHFQRRQLIAVLSFGPSTCIGMLFQSLFFPDILVTYICTAIGCLGLLFTLETPDYHKLMKTMEELEIAKKQAEVATKSKSDFLARMSHEIRTPINAVLGMDEMILRECEDEVINGYAENIKSAGSSLLSIINDILDFSKIESGKFEITTGEYKLEKLIRDCKNLVSSRMEEKGLAFSIDVDENAPEKLVGDEVRIRQIVTNLLTNAAKYTHKGSVKMAVKWLHIDTANGSVTNEDGETREVKKCGGKLTVTVSDTGIGVAPENIDKLFTAFERVDAKATHVIEGTGLGLNITKQLSELMGGNISVESELGKGSVFTLTIPQEVIEYKPLGKLEWSDNAGKVKHKEFVPGYVNPNARILVVDDVQMNLQVMIALLKKTQIKIDTAISGRAAIELVKSNKYDLIFMDHMMPDIDGVETLKLMKEMDDNQSIETPVVVLTANAISGVEKMYEEAGFTGYLSKPVSYAEMEKMLSKFVPMA